MLTLAVSSESALLVRAKCGSRRLRSVRGNEPVAVLLGLDHGGTGCGEPGFEGGEGGIDFPECGNIGVPPRGRAQQPPGVADLFADGIRLDCLDIDNPTVLWARVYVDNSQDTDRIYDCQPIQLTVIESGC